MRPVFSIHDLNIGAVVAKGIGVVRSIIRAKTTLCRVRASFFLHHGSNAEPVLCDRAALEAGALAPALPVDRLHGVRVTNLALGQLNRLQSAPSVCNNTRTEHECVRMCTPELAGSFQ
jgi:hypothetical protein